MKKMLGLCMAILCHCFLGHAQIPMLIKDINTGSAAAFNGQNLGRIVLQDKLIFTANDGVHGYELWVSDLTTEGTVLLKDINVGAGSSSCQYFRASDSLVFFIADDGIHGRELWRTNGTPSGTFLVKDIAPGAANGSGNPAYPDYAYYVWENVLYFSATSGGVNDELWRSDGTEAGTYLLKEIHPSYASFPTYFEAYNGYVYFQARTPMAGIELWRTNGTTAGTTLVKDFDDDLFPSDMTACNGYLLFIANTNSSGNQELWRTDGTAAGTVLVKEINPSALYGGLEVTLNTFDKRLYRLGNVVYFAANDGTNGAELWRSDGTAGGTYMVKNTNTPNGIAPQNFTAANNILFYKNDDGVTGAELWRSDGTEAGTYLLKDIAMDFNSSLFLPTYITGIGNYVYFRANTNNAFDNYELWRSDGTTQGTVLLYELQPGNTGSHPYGFIGVNNTVVYSAQTNTYGSELWKVTEGSSTPLNLTINITATIACAGDSTGALTAVTSGGVPPYTYTWSPPTAQGQNPTGLSAGTYFCTVTDVLGQTKTGLKNLNQPALISASANIVDETAMTSNGAITINPTGGTAPYTVMWNTNPPVSGTTLSNLSAGNYTATITDANNCSVIKNYDVERISSAAYLDNSHIVVSPNPATDVLLLSGISTGVKTVQLVNSVGGSFLLPVEQGRISLENLPKGNYFLLLQEGDKRYTPIAIQKL